MRCAQARAQQLTGQVGQATPLARRRVELPRVAQVLIASLLRRSSQRRAASPRAPPRAAHLVVANAAAEEEGRAAGCDCVSAAPLRLGARAHAHRVPHAGCRPQLGKRHRVAAPPHDQRGAAHARGDRRVELLRARMSAPRRRRHAARAHPQQGSVAPRRQRTPPLHARVEHPRSPRRPAAPRQRARSPNRTPSARQPGRIGCAEQHEQVAAGGERRVAERGRRV
jgi:hypothetical protein